MQKSNLYFTIFQKISEHLTILLNISNTPILTLARFLIYPSIQSCICLENQNQKEFIKSLENIG